MNIFKSRPRFGRRARLTATFAFAAIAGAVSAQEIPDGFALLPERDALIGTTTGGGFDFSTETGGSLNYAISGPVQQRPNGWVLYDLEYSSSLDPDMSTNGAALTAGIIYRSYLNDETIFGLNAYLDAGRRSDVDDFMGLASFGVEYEKRPDVWDGSFVQAGGNFYIPLDDYTNIAEYGELSSAPRSGIDGYASFGRSFDGYSWLGSLYGFNYFETDTAFDLTGYAAEGAVEWTRGLPVGWTATGSVGIQDDSRIGQDVALYAGLALDYTFGGTNDVLPARDCALVRGDDGSTNIDCTEAVIPNASGTLLAKDGTGISPSLSVRTARVVRPRRHVAFGTPFTPIEYKPQTATLQIMKVTADDADNTFTFSSDIAELTTSITTIGGAGASSEAEVAAGTYTISEINLPDGYSLADVGCAGATNFTPDLEADSVSVTVDAGQTAVCTFTNGFVQPTGTLQIAKLLADGAADGTFSFTSTADGLAGDITTVSGEGQNIAVSVVPGEYTITETNLPDGYSLDGVTCSEASGSTFNSAENSVDVTVGAGQATVCTFTNSFAEARGTVQIIKEANSFDQFFPGPAQDFVFDGSIDELDLTFSSPGGARQRIVGDIIPVDAGVYTITEVDLPENWELSNVRCLGASSQELVPGGIQFTVPPGRPVICEFINVYKSTMAAVRLFKSVTSANAPAQDFVFSSSVDEFNRTFSGSGGFQSFRTEYVLIEPGTPYTITEGDLPEFWRLEYAECNPDFGDSSYTPIPGGVEFIVEPGRAMSCAFNNVYEPPQANITFVKEVNGNPPSGMYYSIGAQNQDTFVTVGADFFDGGGDSPIFTVEPGSYSVYETIYDSSFTPVLEDWTTNISCDSDSFFISSEGDEFRGPVGDLFLEDGDDVTCTFTNTYVDPNAGSIRFRSGDGGIGACPDELYFIRWYNERLPALLVNGALINEPGRFESALATYEEFCVPEMQYQLDYEFTETVAEGLGTVVDEGAFAGFGAYSWGFVSVDEAGVRGLPMWTEFGFTTNDTIYGASDTTGLAGVDVGLVVGMSGMECLELDGTPAEIIPEFGETDIPGGLERPHFFTVELGAGSNLLCTPQFDLRLDGTSEGRWASVFPGYFEPLMP